MVRERREHKTFCIFAVRFASLCWWLFASLCLHKLFIHLAWSFLSSHFLLSPTSLLLEHQRSPHLSHIFLIISGKNVTNFFLQFILICSVFSCLISTCSWWSSIFIKDNSRVSGWCVCVGATKVERVDENWNFTSAATVVDVNLKIA